jgi:hypothetical protein
LYIWPALKDATDQGEVAMGGPVTGPVGEVFITAIDKEGVDSGAIPVDGADGKICDLVKGAGERRKPIEGRNWRNAHSFHPTAQGTTAHPNH